MFIVSGRNDGYAVRLNPLVDSDQHSATMIDR